MSKKKQEEATGLEAAPAPDPLQTETAPGPIEAEPAPDEGAPAAETSELEDVTVPSVDEGDPSSPLVESPARLESIVESLLFASDRPLTIADLKRLLGERDTKKVAATLEALKTRHQDSGIQLASLAGGFQFRTHPGNGAWVAKLVAGRPQRLSRAMLETLAIVAYRQPITRPEMDEIRGVDCGPVLKTLLDRGLIRMIGKKEDVGRPILYGTTLEFLRTFSLRDLAELPTLREFHELNEAHRAEVDAKTETKTEIKTETNTVADATSDQAPTSGASPPPGPRFALATSDPDEEDDLIAELDRAAGAAAKALESPPGLEPEGPPAGAPDA
jgi:segregation and condensation protein B